MERVALGCLMALGSYGVFVSQGLKAVVPSPGQACRGDLR